MSYLYSLHVQPLPQRCSLSEAVVFSSDLRLIEQYEARSSWLPPTSEGNELTSILLKKNRLNTATYTERDTALQVSKPLVGSKTAASSLSKLRPLACQNYGLYSAKTTACILSKLRPLSQIVGVMCVMCI